jgi:hypothetical protein
MCLDFAGWEIAVLAVVTIHHACRHLLADLKI